MASSVMVFFPSDLPSDLPSGFHVLILPLSFIHCAGLSDAYDNSLMGMCAELIASDHKLTREMQV